MKMQLYSSSVQDMTDQKKHLFNKTQVGDTDECHHGTGKMWY